MTRSGTGGSLERCSRKPIRRSALSNNTKVTNEVVDNLTTVDIIESGKNIKEIEGKNFNLDFLPPLRYRLENLRFKISLYLRH